MTQVARPADWPAWRGPAGNGHTAEKDLPLNWGGKDNDNVLWRVKHGERSYCSPIVWGDKVFLTTGVKISDADNKNKVIPEHYVVCYQAADGKELWRTRIEPGKWFDGNGIYTAPTPITDGTLVYCWFGSAVMVALDFDGKIVWRREVPGPFSVYPSLSSSPVLYEDNVLLLVDQSKDSFLMALDRKTGEVKWEQKRPKMQSTNSSPLLMPVQNKVQLVVASGRALQGLDPADGKVLWSCGKDGGYWTSLTYGSGLVYTDSGGGRGLAVDPSGTGEIDKTQSSGSSPRYPKVCAAR